ncbi:MAG: divergent polysaccharide deacetylase family protein [Candidatus Cloacimonetes bacterium]|nr:divergent polysaccharide deacetylase family protein [Candidatus Cloacimonadota bacterium]
MAKKRKRSNKPRKITKKKNHNIRNMIFLVGCVIAVGFLSVYFVLPIINISPEEATLVAINETSDIHDVVNNQRETVSNNEPKDSRKERRVRRQETREINRREQTENNNNASNQASHSQSTRNNVPRETRHDGSTRNSWRDIIGAGNDSQEIQETRNQEQRTSPQVQTPNSQSNTNNDQRPERQQRNSNDSWRDIIGFGQESREESQRVVHTTNDNIQLPQEIIPEPQQRETFLPTISESDISNLETQIRNNENEEINQTIAASTTSQRLRERDRERQYIVNPNLPKILIIIDDFGGIGNSLFQRFNSLDREIAFAVLPGLRFSQDHQERAVAAGREVIIHIPMEPEGRERQEPNTILTSMNDFQIRNQIDSWIVELPLAIGVNNHMGSKATQDDRVLEAIMQSLRPNNMFFIDSFTTGRSRVTQVAQRSSVKTATRDIFLDVPDSSLTVARDKINEIKRIRNQEVIIVITHCHNDMKYRQLVHFVDRLKEEGFQLIPPSIAVR